MINYHGSYVEVNTPDIYHSRESVDFGKGFYITPLKEQAEKWAARFKKRGKYSTITKYELDMELCKEHYKILEFTSYSKEWLEYMEANPILLQKKYARIICQLAEKLEISTRESLEIFYHSGIYLEMSEGISDMHCRSEAYLVEEIIEELNQKTI